MNGRFFNVHLKAKFTDVAEDPKSAIRRLGEVRAIRDEILKMFPPDLKARYIVVGDFNDDPKSKPVQGSLKRGETVLGHLLPTEDSHGERWTQFYHGKDIYSRVDYIIVSPEAEKGIKREALRKGKLFGFLIGRMLHPLAGYSPRIIASCFLTGLRHLSLAEGNFVD